MSCMRGRKRPRSEFSGIIGASQPNVSDTGCGSSGALPPINESQHSCPDVEEVQKSAMPRLSLSEFDDQPKTILQEPSVLSSLTVDEKLCFKFPASIDEGSISRLTLTGRVQHVRSFYRSLKCYVVGDTATEYVCAVAYGTMMEIQELQGKLVNGTVWEFSKIQVHKQDHQCISTPVKFVIDLKKTTLRFVESGEQLLQLQQKPIPPRTIADLIALCSQSSSDGAKLLHEDLLAVVTAKHLRKNVLHVTVMDGSETKPGSYAQIEIHIPVHKTIPDMI